MKLYEPFEFLTTEECDRIIEYGRSKVIEEASNSARKNRIVWYEDSTKWSEWIAMLNTIEPVIEWIQTPQISFYNPGEQYDWHTDVWPAYRTHIRHFTLTCELQSAAGAGFEMERHSIPRLEKGQAVIFRSPERHRATTPTKGERVSFTIWAMARNNNKQPFPNATSVDKTPI
jgi:hypothetical protein